MKMDITKIELSHTGSKMKLTFIPDEPLKDRTLSDIFHMMEAFNKLVSTICPSK
jgi:hypothetical protein